MVNFTDNHGNYISFIVNKNIKSIKNIVLTLPIHPSFFGNKKYIKSAFKLSLEKMKAILKWLNSTNFWFFLSKTN